MHELLPDGALNLDLRPLCDALVNRSATNEPFIQRRSRKFLGLLIVSTEHCSSEAGFHRAVAEGVDSVLLTCPCVRAGDERSHHCRQASGHHDRGAMFVPLSAREVPCRDAG